MTDERDTARRHAAPEGGSASERVRAALAAALAGLDLGIEAGEIQVERPDDTAHGDLASNVALVMAKRLKRNPRELAGEIAKRVSLEPIHRCGRSSPAESRSV